MNQRDAKIHTLPGTNILIDGFRFQYAECTAYFLTHFHSDHYAGLDHNFPWSNTKGALLYCSEITAGLIINLFGVSPQYVIPIPFNQPMNIYTSTYHARNVQPLVPKKIVASSESSLLLSTQTTTLKPSLSSSSSTTTTEEPAPDSFLQAPLQITVTLIPANHCPGAAMILFKLSNGRHILHTGDMRFDPSMLHNPCLQSIRSTVVDSTSTIRSLHTVNSGIDEILLDTTYAHPKHTFPSQTESIDQILQILEEYLPDTHPIKNSKITPNNGTTDTKLDKNASFSPNKSFSVTNNAKYAISDADKEAFLYKPTTDVSTSLSESLVTKSLSSPVLPRNAYHIPRVPILVSPGEGETAPLISLYGRFPTLPVPVQDTDKTLVLVQTYVVGKERILLQIAKSLNLKVYVSTKKLRTLELLGIPPEDLAWFATDRSQASVHVVGMGACGRAFPFFQPGYESMQKYMDFVNNLSNVSNVWGNTGTVGRTKIKNGTNTASNDDEDDEIENEIFGTVNNNLTNSTDETGTSTTITITNTEEDGTDDKRGNTTAIISSSSISSTAPAQKYKRIIGIVPTGWVHNAKKKVYTNSSNNVSIYLVPYSEHSSFPELQTFVKYLRPRHITPTVYANEKDADAIRQRFNVLVDHTAAKRVFLQAFATTTSDRNEKISKPSNPKENRNITDDDDAIDITEEVNPCSTEAFQESSTIIIIDDAEVSSASVLSSSSLSTNSIPKITVYCHQCKKERYGTVTTTETSTIQCSVCFSDFVERITKSVTHLSSPVPSNVNKVSTVVKSPTLLQFLKK